MKDPIYCFTSKMNKYRYKTNLFEKCASLEGIFQNLVRIEGFKLGIENPSELVI